MGRGSGRPVDGCGGSCGEDRRQCGATRGDGDCDPTGGTGAASHLLSFLAQDGRLHQIVRKRFRNRYHLFAAKVKLLVGNCAQIRSSGFETFRNMLQ